jgi:hypothetical protein
MKGRGAQAVLPADIGESCIDYCSSPDCVKVSPPAMVFPEPSRMVNFEHSNYSWVSIWISR